MAQGVSRDRVDAGGPGPAASIPRLIMRGVRKRFGATQALGGVDLVVQAGEVHALLGQNGAGKSTLMKVLSGAIQPDAGEMEIDGARYAPAEPLDARRAGVAMIYQELSLAPHLTVAENILLGMEPARPGVVGRLGGVLDRVRCGSRRCARWKSCTIRASAPTRWWAGCRSPPSRSSRSRARWRSAAACWCWTSRPAAWPRPTPRRCSSWWLGCASRARPSSTSPTSSRRCKRVADRFTVLRDGQTRGRRRRWRRPPCPRSSI